MTKTPTDKFERDFIMFVDWAGIWHRQAGGYLASDTAMLLMRIEAYADALIDKHPDLECFRPKERDADQPERPALTIDLNRMEAELAEDIRAIDGNHDKGAGELAEQLVARGWLRETKAPPAVPDIKIDFDKIAKELDDEAAELERLRNFHNEVCAAIANEGPHTVEHLLATAMLGKHTTVIGRSRLKQLQEAEERLAAKAPPAVTQWHDWRGVTEPDWYWWWNGDEDSAPVPVAIGGSWSGKDYDRFAMTGQLGWNREQMVSEMGGLWCRALPPDVGKRVGFATAKSPPAVTREGELPAKPTFYVASRASVPERPLMWRRMRDEGWPINSTWIDEAGEGQTADFAELWQRIENEIRASTAVIVYALRSDFPLKGAFIECGIALGMGKPVAVVMPDYPPEYRTCKPIGSWIKHPLVSVHSTLLSARKHLESGNWHKAAVGEQLQNAKP